MRLWGGGGHANRGHWELGLDCIEFSLTVGTALRRFCYLPDRFALNVVSTCCCSATACLPPVWLRPTHEREQPQRRPLFESLIYESKHQTKRLHNNLAEFSSFFQSR